MRADRLLSLMFLLQSKGRMTAQALSEQLEVSERTIYRDIEALNFAGVPIYTQSGTNGGVFLDANYRISLTGLTKTEIQSLFASTGISGPLKDLGFAKSVEDTLMKLLAALPNVHRDEAERVRQRVYIDHADWFQFLEPPPLLSLLQQAVWEDREIKMQYRRYDDPPYTRIIAPYALVSKANIWYVIARKQNGEMRSYRVSRIVDAQLTGEHFERDPDFDLPTYWQESSKRFEQDIIERYEPYEATLHVSPQAMRYFDAYMSKLFEPVDNPDERGWITIKIGFDSPYDARRWALGFGDDVRVIAPDELREAVIKGAKDIIKQTAHLQNSINP